MIFGYTEDKNKVEVPDKAYVESYHNDTGWVTLVASGRTVADSDSVTIGNVPVAYRKIGNIVYIRGSIASVKFNDMGDWGDRTGISDGLPEDMRPDVPIVQMFDVGIGENSSYHVPLALYVGKYGDIQLQYNTADIDILSDVRTGKSLTLMGSNDGAFIVSYPVD